MRKLYFISLIFIFFTLKIFSQSSFIDLYPLHIGNFWQYKVTVERGGVVDTIYYSNREVLKDTLMANGFIYKKMHYTGSSIFNLNNYLRVDSITGCIYEYDSYFNEEYLIDSLNMMTGDIIINGYGYMLECMSVDTVFLFGADRLRKHFSLNVIPVYYRNKYTQGLGETNRFEHYEYIVGWNITSEITYAKINGEEFGQLVNISENKTGKYSFILLQNYPNPFNPSTKIKYQIPDLSFVIIKVFDVLGKEIITLVNEEKNAGEYEVELNAEKLPSGVYFYTLTAGDFSSTKKLVLLK